MSNTNRNSSGIGLTSLLTVLFVGLKLTANTYWISYINIYIFIY